MYFRTFFQCPKHGNCTSWYSSGAENKVRSILIPDFLISIAVVFINHNLKNYHLPLLSPSSIISKTTFSSS